MHLISEGFNKKMQKLSMRNECKFGPRWMWVSSHPISHTDVTPCPFCHLHSKHSPFWLHSLAFREKKEGRNCHLGVCHLSHSALAHTFLSFLLFFPLILIISLSFLSNVFIYPTTSLTFLAAGSVFLFLLFVFKVIDCSSHLPSRRIFLSEFKLSK